MTELEPLLGGTCTDSVTTDCKRTIYTYTSGGQVDTIQERGNTFNSSGAVVAYDFTTDHSYDTSGRLTQVNGPRTDTTYDTIDFTYYSNTDTDHLRAGHLNQVKRRTQVATYITTTYDSYDRFGNATKVTDPNSNLTCLTYDADRNALASRRVAMANQTSCTADTSDLVTTYAYDHSVRLTRMTQPLGNCVHTEYDSFGRVSKIKERDDCTPASTGHTQEFTYDDDGLSVKVEYKDASGTVTYRRETTHAADRRLFEIINPTQTTKKRTLAYKPDGLLESITGEDSVGKKEWTYDSLNRNNGEKRFVSAGTSDDWSSNMCLQVDRRLTVLDEENKAMDWKWDDLGRKVKQTTPENGTSFFVYDPAGNVTTHVESYGSADQKSHAFTYDPQNRITAENNGDASCFTLGGAEIQYTYDTATGCPTGTCVNINGRLAKVKTKLWCDDSRVGDDSFDQFTYAGYDDAGRLVKETVEDDGGRSAPQAYTWDKNSNLTAVEAPSGIDMKYTYGSPGANSDADRIVALVRNDGADTTFTDNGTWYPFGPLKQYRQQNVQSSNKILAKLTRDLAHRPTEILFEQETSGTDLYRIAYTLDAQGRVTARDFSSADAQVEDSFYLYDWQNRVTCEGRVAPSPNCPTGNSTKSRLDSSPPYSASGERRSISHLTNSFSLETYTYDYVGSPDSSDQINTVTKSGGNVISYTWDGRGNRLSDDDNEWTDDRRDYTYDGRNNLMTVSGKMRIDNTTLHDYTLSNAFDHKNRRIFKGILDEITSNEEHYFFYYDLRDRLIEVKYTPDIGDTAIYQLFQFYWIDDRPIAWVQTSYPAATVTRRFFHADELGVPLDAWSWPSTGSTIRLWSVSPDAFGWADVVLGGSIYQPLAFPGQQVDGETRSLYYNTSTLSYKAARPALNDNRYRTYDPFTGTYLQLDPLVAQTWNSYEYAASNPLMHIDREGLAVDQGWHDGSGQGPVWIVEALVSQFFNSPEFWQPPWWQQPPTGGGGGGSPGTCPDGKPKQSCGPRPTSWPVHCPRNPFGAASNSCCEAVCTEKIRQDVCANDGCSTKDWNECYIRCRNEGEYPYPYFYDGGDCPDGQQDGPCFVARELDESNGPAQSDALRSAQ